MIFNIKNIACKYNNSLNPVLKINDLQIINGEVVFIIGASGVGKSTILETLGLMNNTLISNVNSKFEFSHENEFVSMLDIWNKSEGFLADFRKRNLSFIFQNTNLFPNLNALDNVLLTPLIQGEDNISARNHVRPIFKKIFKNEFKEILNDKKISEMSGGQRQRLAFVRAIATDYNVLFADEPTGNLDWSNANNLMSHLISDIKNKRSTSIIVSHDINLSVLHADKIVYIDKVLDNELNYHYGLISNKNIFTRKSNNKWGIECSESEKSNFSNESLIELLQIKITEKK